MIVWSKINDEHVYIFESNNLFGLYYHCIKQVLEICKFEIIIFKARYLSKIILNCAYMRRALPTKAAKQKIPFLFHQENNSNHF